MKLGLIIFFAANTLAAPFWVLDKDLPRAEVKDVECKTSRFSQGQAFMYDYEGETINRIEGASTQWTGLKLRTQITITPMAGCKFYMQASNTELLEKSMTQGSFVKSSDSESFKSALEKYDLVFFMSGNQISKLLSNKDEPVYILNAKRGILSTIQLEESVSIESDVNGLCETTVVREDGKVIKSKKLSDCTLRTVQEIGFQAATIKSESDLKVLDSNSKCVYKLTGDVITSVNCEETHLFKPFSAGYKAPSGAITTVKQTLNKVQSKKGTSVKLIPVVNDEKMQESSILFDHTSEENQATKTLKSEFEETIYRLANPNEVKHFTVKQDSAHEFATLVFLLRKMDSKRMTLVWSKYYDCIESKLCDSSQVNLRDVYRQYLLDGIAYCGTSTCVSIVHDAIASGAITGERMNIFLQSIALVSKTTRKIVRDIMGIVSKQPTRQGYLTLGTLLNRHCKKNPADCDDVKPNIITQAEDFLIGKLGQSCEGQENNERVEEILLSLKAIANAQRPSRASSIILLCAANSEHVNITNAAFDAIRSMPCDKAIVDKLYNFVKETSNAPDKRIPAFVALMKCPTEVTLEHVVNLLEKEPSNQLASFIWSYLTNILESSNPKHESTKKMLEKITKITPLREFDMPLHQFSRAFEKSVYFPAIKSGASVESHIVFNHENYFPQSAFFDLTAHVLGVPVSLIETNIGIEGMEDLLEQATGKDGFLSKNNIMFNFFNFSVTAQKLRDLAQQREASVERNRRAVDNVGDSISEMHKKVNKKSKLPNGHLSFKVMGQEIRTFSYDDIFYLVDQIDNMNVIQLLLNVAKGGSKTFTKSMMFLEMTQTVPTGLGLPLKLKLVGTTVASVEFNGKFDIRNMFWGPGSLTINGFVKPSAALEISGQMGVDGHFVSSGIFVNSSMFVSNIMKGAIVYQEGKLLKINMDVPEEPVELFKMGSTPFMYLNGQNEAIEGVDRKINPEETCIKSVMIGYGLCTNFRMPLSFREYEAPFFPLSGPAYYGIKLFRSDEKLNTFQFLVSMTKKQPGTSGVIEFSTPGAIYERKIGGEFLFTDVDNEKTLTISAKKSNKAASIEFSYNTLTHQTSMVGKNNFFTEKDIVTKLIFFNTSNAVSINQMGLRFSTEYDWYKFESIGKFVKKATGFMLTGSTLYYPKKSVTGVLEYIADDQKLLAQIEIAEKSFELTGNYQKTGNERGVTIVASSGKTMATFYGGFLNEANKQEVTLSINGFGNVLKNTYTYQNDNGRRSFETKVLANAQVAQLRAELQSENNQNELILTADIVGKTAVSKFVLLNTPTSKEVKVTANIIGNSGQASLKYSNLIEGPSFVASFDAMGKKSNVFVTIDSTKGYKVTVGGVAGSYVAGVRNVYNEAQDTKSLCATLYYGTTSFEKQPGIICATLSSFDKSFMQRKVGLSLAISEKEKNIEFVVDFQKHTSQINLNTDFKLNNNLLFNKKINIKYNELMDSEASISYKVMDYHAGFKLFSKKMNEESQLGFETNVMQTSIVLLHRYLTIGESKDMQMVSEIIVNGKVIPVRTQLNYFKKAIETGFNFKLTASEYEILHSNSFFNNAGAYKLRTAITVNKGVSTIFNLYKDTGLTLTDQTKSLNCKFGSVIFGKTYEYGWETEYKNLGTSDKASVALIGRVQYATNRKSSIILTASNSKSDASVVVNFEYVPSKIVTHSININKNLYQVDTSFEFLPKMFTKFMFHLEKKNGYELITDGSLEWNGYKRSLGVTYAYKHTDDEMIVSSSIGKDLSFSATYLKSSPKSIELSVDAFKNNVKWIGVFKNSNIQSGFVWNGKMLLNVGTDLQFDFKTFSFKILNGKDTVLKISESFNDVKDKLALKFADMQNLVSFNGKMENDEMIFSISGKEEWISFNGKLNRKMNTVSGLVSVFKKMRLEVIGEFPTNAYSLIIRPSFMNEFSFNAEYNPGEKAVTLKAKTKTRTVGVTLRGDIQNIFASIQLFCNENRSSLEFFVEKKSFISRLSLTPKFALQFVFDILNDNTLMVTVQTVNEGKPVTQTSLKYQLSKGLSQLVLNWNKESASKLYNDILLIMDTFNKKSMESIKMSANFFTESASDAKTASTEFINMMDKAYSQVDLKLAQVKLESVAVNTVQQLSQIIKYILKAAVRNIDSLKSQLPRVFQSLKQFSGQTKIVLLQIKQAIIEINSDLEKNWEEVVVIVSRAISNITKSSKPVAVKAFELIRGFKVQGMTIEEYLLFIQTKGAEKLNTYIKNADNNITLLITKVKEYYNESGKSILLARVPYTSETVEEVLAIILKKGLELKKLIEELSLKLKDQMSDIDMQKSLLEIKTKLMNYKIQSKSVEEHLTILKKKLDTLPPNIQLTLNKMQEVIQKLGKVTQENLNKILKFLAPLIEHVKLVNTSVKKHFQPLLTKSANEIFTKVSKIQMQNIEQILKERWIMIEKYIFSSAESIRSLYNEMKKQINSFEINGFRIESLLNSQGKMVTQYAQEIIVKARMNADDQMKVLSDAVEKVSKMTHGEMQRRFVGFSDIKNKEAIQFITNIKTKNDKMVLESLEKVKSLWNKLKLQYTVLTSQPLEDVISSLFNSSADNILATAEDLSKALKELSEIDIEKKIIRAWEKSNLSSSVSRLQMESAIKMFVKPINDVNITDIALKTITLMQQFIADIYSSAYISATKVYGNIDKVVTYLKTMPELEYNKWFSELRTYALKSSKEIKTLINKVYSSNKERFDMVYVNMPEVSADQIYKVYSTNKVHLDMLYSRIVEVNTDQIYSVYTNKKVQFDMLLTKLSQIDFNQIYEEYVKPSKKWMTELYDRINEKSALVYADIKDPSIKVYTHYKSIVSSVIEENYDALKVQAMKLYEAFLSELTNKLNKLSVQLQELTTKLNSVYWNFMKTYGDMTWEQIGEEMYTYGTQMAKAARINSMQFHKKLLKIMNVYQDEAMKMYIMTTTKLNQYLDYIQSKVQPRAIKVYINYKIFVEKRIGEIKKKITEITNLLQEQISMLKQQVVSVYNANKNKSLKKLYTDLITITGIEINKQYKLVASKTNDVVKMVLQKYAEVLVFATNYYTKADVLLRTVIIPELAIESESFVNQTLRLSVILANETIKAFSPHYYLVKDVVNKFTKEMKIKVFDMSQEVSTQNIAVLEENLAKLSNLLNTFFTKLQKNDIVSKAVSHEYVRQSTSEINKLKDMIMVKMEQLKSNPTSIEYKLQAERAVEKVQAYFKKSQELGAYYSQHAYYNEIMQFMQKIQESGMYTIDKASQKLTPDFDAVTTAMLTKINRIISNVKKDATSFRQYPEETFWMTFNAAKENVKANFQSVVSIDKETFSDINKRFKRWVLDLKRDDYFNEWTKTSIEKALKYGQSTSESLLLRIQSLVSDTKTTILSFYKVYIEKITSWYNSQVNSFPGKWSKCPIQSIFANPIWNELKNEVTNHELVVIANTIANTIAGKSQEKYVDIRDKALAELKAKNVELGNNMQFLNAKLTNDYYQTKEKTMVQYKQFTENYSKLVKKSSERYQELVTLAAKFFEETTVSDIATVIQSKINEFIEKLSDAKMKFNDLTSIYTAKSKVLFNKYSTDFNTLFQNYKANAITAYNQYQLKATESFTKLHKELQVLLSHYKQTLMPFYIKCEAALLDYYNQYYPIVLGKYNYVYLRVESKITETKSKYEQVLTEVKKQTLDMVTLAYKQSYAQWMQSDLRAKLLSLRKMTVKETITVLLRLPSQAKIFAIETFTKFHKLALDLKHRAPESFSQFYTSAYNTCLHLCNTTFKSIHQNYNRVYKTAQQHYNNVYTNTLIQINEKRHYLEALLKPFVDSSLKLFMWIKNEVTESVLFTYQYYRVDEKFKAYQNSLFSEYKYLIPIIEEYKGGAQKLVVEYKELALKYTEQAQVLFEKYKKVAQKYIKEYQAIAEKFAGDYKDHVQKIVTEYKEQAVKYYEIYKEQTQKMITKYKEQAVKYYEIYKEQTKKMIMNYKEIALKYVKEYQAFAEKFSVDYKEQLPKLVTKYKELALKYAGEYKELVLKMLVEYKEVAHKMLVEYKELFQRNVKGYQTIVEKFIGDYKKHVQKLMEYKELALKDIEVYREQAHKKVKEYKETAVRLFKEYQPITEKFIIDYKNQAIEFFTRYFSIAQKATLKALDEGKKIFNSINMEKVQNQVESAAKFYMNELNKYVSIETKNGEILVNVYHREITPKFSDHVKSIGLRSRRSIDAVKQKGNEMISSIETQLKELKIKFQQLIEKIQLFIRNSSSIKATLLATFQNSSKILETALENGMQQVNVVYKNGLKQFETLKIEAKRMIKQFQNLSMTLDFKKAQELSLNYYIQAKGFFLKSLSEAQKHYSDYYHQAQKYLLKYYSQVQEFSLKYYNQAQKFSMEYYNQAQKFSMEYYNQAQKFYSKYLIQAQKLYSDNFNQTLKIFLKYYNQAQQFSLEYYNQAQKLYPKYLSQVQKYYSEYYNQVQKYYTQAQDFSLKYYNLAQKLYSEYYSEAQKFSLKYYQMAQKLYSEYYSEAQKFSLKYYQMAQKLYSEYYSEAQKFSLKYYQMAQKLYSEYYSEAQKFSLKYYQIAQKLSLEYYNQTQKFSLEYYSQVQKLYSEYLIQAQKFSLKYYSLAQKLSSEYYNQFQKFYFDYYNQAQKFSLEYYNLIQKIYSEYLRKGQKFSLKNYELAQKAYLKYYKQIEKLSFESYKQAQKWSLKYYDESKVTMKDLLTKVNALSMEFSENPYAFLKMAYKKSMEILALWSANAEKIYQQYQTQLALMINEQQVMLTTKVKDASEQMRVTFNELETKVKYWKSKATHENLSALLKTAHKNLMETFSFWSAKAEMLYQQYQPQLALMLNEQQTMLTIKAKDLLSQMRATYDEVETAVNSWKSGVSAEKAFYQLLRKTKYVTKFFSFDTLEKIRQSLCAKHLEACKQFTDSIYTQVVLLQNYINDLFNLMTANEVAVLQYMRSRVHTMQHQKQSLMGSLATAVIFGNNHVVTFDKKVYDFVDYNQRDCTYMLAHDFVNGKFSVMRQMDTIIVTTPEMTIKIKTDGKTQAIIGDKVVNSLPVESESNKCIRLYDVISCEFMEQGVFVNVDLTNFITTVQLSSWHFGKTQGVLGTYNYESYDDWKMPDNKIADSVYKFANAYEITKKRSCVAEQPKEKTSCANVPSPKCKELFNSSSSMFARFFSVIDPKPFLDACEYDTSCKSIGHCSAVAAYRGLLKAVNENPDFCPDCVEIDSHKLNEEWSLKPTGAVDIVMLVSEKESGKTFKKQLMKMMIQVQQFMRINKYEARYALIGFGGKGVHESSQIHPIGTGDVFGSSEELIKEIKSMEFNGDNESLNDAFEAITMASKLSFRPGASRIFILHTEDEVKSSLSGITQAEARHFLENEANASLIVFQNLDTKFLAQQLKGNFIGETAQRVYSDKAPTGTQKGSQSLTSSVFKKLTDSSNGALFTTDFTSVNIVSKSLFDVMSFNIQRVNSQCQRCSVRAQSSGDAVAICVLRNDITC